MICKISLEIALISMRGKIINLSGVEIVSRANTYRYTVSFANMMINLTIVFVRIVQSIGLMAVRMMIHV